jgi:ferrous iron transport protein B
MSEITIALVGNPNVGKSTVFNALTGSDQQVGNWPGKTVEKRTGTLRLVNGQRGASPSQGVRGPFGQTITMVDLPGTYSLSAYSMEEEIARDFIVDEYPQLVINVVDAANIERNLYLTAQILETGVPLIIVLNMLDQAEAQDIKIDVARLSSLLGNTPVVSLVARQGQGIDTLQELILTQVGAGMRDRAK